MVFLGFWVFGFLVFWVSWGLDWLGKGVFWRCHFLVLVRWLLFWGGLELLQFCVAKHMLSPLLSLTVSGLVSSIEIYFFSAVVSKYGSSRSW